MQIKHLQFENKGEFIAITDDKTAGKMTYSKAGFDKIIIDHTEVNSDFAGSGVGKALVAKAVEYARATEIKILPLCPFASSVFKRMPDWHDVLV
jgi:predicted GNAT family acetyltransferase